MFQQGLKLLYGYKSMTFHAHVMSGLHMPPLGNVTCWVCGQFAMLLPRSHGFSCLQASHEGVKGPCQSSYDEQDSDAEAQRQMNA